MEAIAKHDFTATAEDELSFRRSQVLKVGRTLEMATWLDLYSRHLVRRPTRRVVLRRLAPRSIPSPSCRTAPRSRDLWPISKFPPSRLVVDRCPKKYERCCCIYIRMNPSIGIHCAQKAVVCVTQTFYEDCSRQ